jgi:hemerythrin-like domain-containing protein
LFPDLSERIETPDTVEEGSVLPIGPLMIEHRLIERMIRVVEKRSRKAEVERKIDPVFIDELTDFIRHYADECHHGKEEDILFRELDKKPLSHDHRRIMEELLQEHARGREILGRVEDGNARYRNGAEGALDSILKGLKELLDLYPNHIEKEDKRFFIPAMDYFEVEEKERMLKEEYAFDQTLFHRKYQEVVKKAEEDTT